MRNEIRKALYQYRFVKPKRVAIGYADIRKAFPRASYRSLHAGLTALLEEGSLGAIKASGTNGMVPPLPKRFRIQLEREDDYTEEVKTLYVGFQTLQYLRNPDKYVRDRDIIKPLSDYLKENGEDALKDTLLCNQRALQIWRNEKFLDRANRTRLARILSENGFAKGFLNFEYIAEPLPYFQASGALSETALIVENKDTYGSLMILAKEISLPYNVVVFGYGNMSSRQHGGLSEFLHDLERSTGIRTSSCEYFGDLDPEGIRILERVRAVNEIRIVPHYGLYQLLVEKGKERSFPWHNEQKGIDDLSVLRLSPEDESFVLQMFREKRFVPQEAVNLTMLDSYFR